MGTGSQVFRRAHPVDTARTAWENAGHERWCCRRDACGGTTAVVVDVVDRKNVAGAGWAVAPSRAEPALLCPTIDPTGRTHPASENTMRVAAVVGWSG